MLQNIRENIRRAQIARDGSRAGTNLYITAPDSRYYGSVASDSHANVKANTSAVSSGATEFAQTQSPMHSCLGSITQKSSPYVGIQRLKALNTPNNITPNSLKDQMVKIRKEGFQVYKSQTFNQLEGASERDYQSTITVDRKRDVKAAQKALGKLSRAQNARSEIEPSCESRSRGLLVKSGRQVKTCQQRQFLIFLYMKCKGKQPGGNILEIISPGLGLSVHQIQKWFWEETKKLKRIQSQTADDDYLEDGQSYQPSQTNGSSQHEARSLMQFSHAAREESDQERSLNHSQTSLKSLESQEIIQSLSDLMNIPVDFIAESVVDMPSPNRTRIVIKDMDQATLNHEQAMPEKLLRQSTPANLKSEVSSGYSGGIPQRDEFWSLNSRKVPRSQSDWEPIQWSLQNAQATCQQKLAERSGQSPTDSSPFDSVRQDSSNSEGIDQAQAAKDFLNYLQKGRDYVIQKLQERQKTHGNGQNKQSQIHLSSSEKFYHMLKPTSESFKLKYPSLSADNILQKK